MHAKDAVNLIKRKVTGRAGTATVYTARLGRLKNQDRLRGPLLGDRGIQGLIAYMDRLVANGDAQQTTRDFLANSNMQQEMAFMLNNLSRNMNISIYFVLDGAGTDIKEVLISEQPTVGPGVQHLAINPLYRFHTKNGNWQGEVLL